MQSVCKKGQACKLAVYLMRLLLSQDFRQGIDCGLILVLEGLQSLLHENRQSEHAFSLLSAKGEQHNAEYPE